MARHWSLQTKFLVLCVTTIATAGDLKLQFLKGVPRFSSSTGYTDYYFCCNVVGRFLRWEIGADYLAGFGIGDTSRVIVNTRSTYEYTATLLSSQPLPDSNQHQMDSAIVVTFVGMTPSEFQVTCTSETNSSTIQVVGNMSAVESTDSSDHNKVVLDYIVTNKIVQNKNFTHILICGTLDEQQYYEVEDFRIGFGASDIVGQERPVWSSDGYTVIILSVLVARHPYISIAILFVSEDYDVNVTCFYENHQTQLLTDGNSASTTMPIAASTQNPTLNVPMNPTSSPTTPENQGNVTSPENQGNVTSPISPHTTDKTINNTTTCMYWIAAVLVLLFILIAIVVAAAFTYWLSSKRRGQMEDEGPSDENGPAQVETTFVEDDCSKEDVAPDNMGEGFPEEKEPSKETESEESDSEGYVSSVWSASEDSLSDDKSFRKFFISMVSDGQENRNFFRPFVDTPWPGSCDTLVFMKPSRRLCSRQAKSCIVIGGDTQEIHARNDLMFLKPSPKILCSVSLSIVDKPTQEMEDGSSSSKAVYLPLPHRLQNEGCSLNLTVKGSRCWHEEGSKIDSLGKKLLLQPVNNLERKMSMVVQGARDLDGACYFKKAMVVLNMYKDKEAGSQGLINTRKMVTVQQVMTKKLVTNLDIEVDDWMQVIHRHILHMRKTLSSPVPALVSQDASLKSLFLSSRMPGYRSLRPHHKYPYLKHSTTHLMQRDNKQQTLSDSSSRPISARESSLQQTHLQYHQQQYLHGKQCLIALALCPDQKRMVHVHEPPHSEFTSSYFYLFSPCTRMSLRKQRSRDSTPASSLTSPSSMSSNSSSMCNRSNTSVEGGKAGSAGIFDQDKWETKTTFGVQVSDPGILGQVEPANQMVNDELCTLPLERIHALVVQQWSLKVATGWEQTANSRNFSK